MSEIKWILNHFYEESIKFLVINKGRRKVEMKKMLLLMVLALSIFMCSVQKEEKKEEPKKEKASEEEKNKTIKALEEQKALELTIPNLKDSDKESIEKKYENLIAQVKEDKIDKEEVIKLGKAAENYIKNVKESKSGGSQK